MATVVIVATVVAAWRVFDVTRAHQILIDGIWSALFVANFKFASEGTDYFAVDRPPSPLQHYWSLSIEEQFYFVWPLLLAITVFGFTTSGMQPGRRRGRAEVRVFAVLGLVISASLSYSIYLTAQVPTSAYFTPFARCWELALGAVLAVAEPHAARMPGRIADGLSWVGVAGIAAATVFYGDQTPFPGYAALLPTLAASAVIIGGTARSSGVGAQRVLRMRPFQSLGDVSYSVYLWHWPVLTIGAAALGRSEPGVTINLALLVLALVVSYVGYYLVEQPFRTGAAFRLQPRASLVLYPISITVVLVVSVVAQSALRSAANERIAELTQAVPVSMSGTAPARGPHPVTLREALRNVSRSVELAHSDAAFPAILSPSIWNIAEDWDYPAKCISEPPTSTNSICPYGDVASDRVLVLAGDSHALQWLPALDAVGEARGWRVIPMVKIYCFSAMRPGGRDSAELEQCRDWQKWLPGAVAQLRPEVVVLANNMSGAQHLDEQLWMTATMDAVRQLGGNGIKSYVLADTPQQHEDPYDCLLREGSNMGTCSASLDEVHLRHNEAARDGAAAAGARYVALDDLFCAGGTCPAVVGTTIAYKDLQHISKTMALGLSEILGDRLNL